MYILHRNICAISSNRTQNQHFPKNTEKIVTIAHPSKLCLKNRISIIFQIYIMQNFVRLHAIESEIEVSQEF